MIAPRRKILPIPIHRKQAAFLALDCWMQGLVSGRGGGKSRVGAYKVLKKAKGGDPWMAISPDNNVIRETTLPTFTEVAKQTGQYIKHVVSPTPRCWFRTRDGGTAEIVFKGAEEPDKLRGPNKAGLWIDEASIVSEMALDVAIGVCRWRGEMGPVICTFTPRGLKHWTFERFFEPVPDDKLAELIEADAPLKFIASNSTYYLPRPDTGLIQCKTSDNPFAPTEFVKRIGQNYSTMFAMQELGGEFVEIAGLLFRRDWFHMVDAAPHDCARVRYWDKAATAESGCYTVGLLMAKDRMGTMYVEDVVRGQWSAHQRNQVMLQVAMQDSARYYGTVETYIEQEGGGDGKTVADDLLRMLSEFSVHRDLVGGTKWKQKGGVRLPGDAKVRRAMPFAACAERGNVRIVKAPWNNAYLEEVSAFPEYAYADQVDASSGAYNKLAGHSAEHLFAERHVEDANVSHYGESVALTGGSTARWEDLPWSQ